MRTHLGHKYTLATHALPLSGRDLQYTHLCPARSPGTQSSAPMEISSDRNLAQVCCARSQTPLPELNHTHELTDSDTSTSEARQHLCAHAHGHVLRRPTRGQEPRARPLAPPALERWSEGFVQMDNLFIVHGFERCVCV